MGEEEKKPEEKKGEEKKAEERKEEKKEEEKAAEKIAGEEKKEGAAKEEAPPPPPQEVVLKVYMHCEGCARKIRRRFKGFDGVDGVITDCKTSTVVVKGEKAAADPMKVLERIQMKSHRQVELISPIPKPPSEEEKKPKEEEKPKPEEKKEEPPVIIVVLQVYMHCEACAMEIKKRIQRMKGVESAEPDLKSSQVTVKGVFDAQKLVEYVHKRTGKQAVIVKIEPEKKEEEKGKESKKEEGEKENKGGGSEEGSKEKKEKEGESGGKEVGEVTQEVELKRNEYYYYPPRSAMEMYAYPPSYAMETYANPPRYAMETYAYPPQIFSDENPNACTVM